jgi:hypothetical protein
MVLKFPGFFYATVVEASGCAKLSKGPAELSREYLATLLAKLGGR